MKPGDLVSPRGRARVGIIRHVLCGGELLDVDWDDGRTGTWLAVDLVAVRRRTATTKGIL